MKKEDYENLICCLWLIASIFLIMLVGFINVKRCEAGEVEIDMDRIMLIESSGNPNAVNKRTGAIGLYQITPIVLEDWNMKPSGNCDLNRNDFFWNCKIYALHLYDPFINIEIAYWYMEYRIPQMLKNYDLEDTVEARLISWHDGIGNYKKYVNGKRKLGKEMRGFLKKYYK